MSKTHPSPFSYQKKEEIDENIIGWFMISFNVDPNHEYGFTVYKDGKIVRDYDFLNVEEMDTDSFFIYLQDKDVHTVRFIQQSGKEVNYTW